jgi:hypothetical protein
MAKIILENSDYHNILSKFGYKNTGHGVYDHKDGHQVQLNHPLGVVHIMGKEIGPYHNGATINIKDPDDLHDHLMSIHPYNHGRGN